jgi:acetyltransferase-like isoleucine patch superfamily enzyme
VGEIIHKLFFRLEYKLGKPFLSFFYKNYFRLRGAKIGNTIVPKVFMTWPHQVMIGNYCRLERNINFKFDGLYRPGTSIVIEDFTFIGANCELNITDRLHIGKKCLIASGCKFIDHDHGFKRDHTIQGQPCTEKGIDIEDDVWLGANVIVLKGVHISKGAIVGAGSVVKDSIPSYEIWAGIPAKKIGERK